MVEQPMSSPSGSSAATAAPGVRLCRFGLHEWQPCADTALADCLVCAACDSLRANLSVRAPSDRDAVDPPQVVPGFVHAIIDAATARFSVVGGTREQYLRYPGVRDVCIMRTSCPAATADERVQRLRARFERRHVRCRIYGEDEAGRLIAVFVAASDTP
jgi:hypothetical protein